MYAKLGTNLVANYGARGILLTPGSLLTSTKSMYPSINTLNRGLRRCMSTQGSRLIENLKEDVRRNPNAIESLVALWKEQNAQKQYDQVMERFNQGVPFHSDLIKEYVNAKAGKETLLYRAAAAAQTNYQYYPSNSSSYDSSSSSSSSSSNSNSNSNSNGNSNSNSSSSNNNGKSNSSNDSGSRDRVIRLSWSTWAFLFGSMGAYFVASFFLPTWLMGKQGTDTEKKGPLFNMGDNHKKANGSNVRFSDVKGVDEAKAELEDLVEYLKNPDKFKRLGAKMPKGVLLCGSPGTGKTMLAKAIAGEAGVPFFYISGSGFDEMLVGVGSRRVRNLFADAKANAPCIIFIDEIDSVGFSRKKTLRLTNTKDDTLNQLLTELDGFKENEGIILIGATNLPENLDEALTRPGRFDKIVTVPLPDVKGRQEIIDYYLGRIVKAEGISSEILARGTPGFTGADLANMINVAAIKATVRNQDCVTKDSLDDARDEVLMGLERKQLIMTEEERKLTAYHEAGHALVAFYTDGAIPIHKATIAPRGQALGMVSYLPEGDQVSMSRKKATAHLTVSLGGRAAEELIFGYHSVTSGASSDFKGATNIATNMVAHWGMSDKLGVVYHEIEGPSVPSATRRLIDEEVKSILDKQYTQAKSLLKSHEKDLHMLANALLEYETLSLDEIKAILKGESLEKQKKLPPTTGTKPPSTTQPQQPPAFSSVRNDNK
jgi:ATP-dependent metalloprotease